MSRSTYIAITIGLIIDTISAAKATRELWSSSYMFSYLMKGIARKLKQGGSREFVLPYVDDENLFSSAGDRPAKYRSGAGVFPDRLIFKAAGGDSKESIEQLIGEVIGEFAGQVAGKLKLTAEGQVKAVRDYIIDYIQTDVVVVDLGKSPKPILDLTPYLDSLELQRRFPTQDRPYLREFFNRVNRSFLVEDAFGEKAHGFQTLLHIAAREFEATPEYRSSLGKLTDKDVLTEGQESSLTDLENEADRNLIKQLASAYRPDSGRDLTFKPVHKYIAIVYSDGDKVGEIVKSIEGSGGSHQGFSAAMNRFALDAVEKIQEYGGMPVYAGGDDLLFFAPVVNKGQNIFGFLQELDTAFQDLFKEFDQAVSQSFGLAIAYYKHPMSETLESARDLLFLKAKTGAKNNIAFRLQKHSGSFVETVLHIPSDASNLFQEVLKASLLNDGSDLLRSVIYKIRESEKLIGLIARDEVKIKNYLANSFNESIHYKGPFKDFLANIGKLIHACYMVHPKDDARAHQQLFSLLRTLAYLTQKEDRA